MKTVKADISKKDKKITAPLNLPQRIVLELTPHCNLSCPMCPRHYIQLSDSCMSKYLWKKLIDEIAETNPDAIILPFWRGESLLHPDFIELLEHALDKSLRIHISTNGHLITREKADALGRCEFVTFSIHTPQGYSNAKEFLNLKKEGRPTVQISFVENEKSTEKFLHTLITTDNLGGFDSIRLYEEHTKNGVFGKSSQSLNIPRTFCQKLLDTLIIAFDGSISRCNHIWETEDGMNANDMDIKDIWSSKRLKQIRDDYPDFRCKPCDQWTGHTCGESWRIIKGRLEHKVYTPVKNS